MTHLVKEITSITPDDINRLFDASRNKVLEGTIPFDGELTDYQARTWLTSDIQTILVDEIGVLFGYYKDDHLCFVRYGVVNDGVLEQSYYLAGNDADGSRAYLYSQEFADALKTYYQANFTAVDSWAIAGKSTAAFEEDVLKPNLYEIEGVAYVKEDFTDEVTNITYEKRTITF